MTLVEALGHEQLVHVVTARREPLVVRMPSLGGGLAPRALSVGTAVQIGVDSMDVHLFETATTKRLDA